MEGVVEFHGFKSNSNKFVVKELAIVSKYFQTHLVFDAPHDECLLDRKMRKTARWLANNFHFMRWTDKGIPYDEEWIRILCSQFSVLYTKGEEKVEFLKQFHNNVQGIPESYKSTYCSKVTCILPQHNNYYSGGRCAMRSAKAFYMLKFGKSEETV